MRKYWILSYIRVQIRKKFQKLDWLFFRTLRDFFNNESPFSTWKKRVVICLTYLELIPKQRVGWCQGSIESFFQRIITDKLRLVEIHTFKLWSTKALASTKTKVFYGLVSWQTTTDLINQSVRNYLIDLDENAQNQASCSCNKTEA